MHRSDEQNSSLQLAEASESHHISSGRAREKHSTCFCVNDSPFCYHWHRTSTARINQLTFCAVTVLVMSHDCTGLRLVPDNNALHWASHTDAAPRFASFKGWASWKNVKHPGNPWGALVDRHRSNKCVDLRDLTCHWLLQNTLWINEKKWKQGEVLF